VTLWGGRFEGGPVEEMQRFSESLAVDLRMADEDIDASLAHVGMLEQTGILDSGEASRLREGLRQVRDELADGRYRPDIGREDVHMAVEARLTEIVGEVGGKLHTARSRNDQVATDVRLWLKRRLGALSTQIRRLVGVLLRRIAADGRVLIPGFTHLQRGQPIWLGHHLLAHAWPLSRDLARLGQALERVDLSPLGAGAMGGTPHPIDRGLSARLLGFRGVIPNAMDAVSARDHLLEATSVCAIVMVHLSRMAEELVLWSSSEFAFVRLADDWSTGSSIMPQKRNPDAAELVRGKSGRVIGDLASLLVMVKGLPLAYNRDLQEDREALFDAVETTTACVSVMAGMWDTLRIQRERWAGALEGDFLLATELADFLVEKGVPFREAHHVAGRLVAWCEARGGNFSLLTLDVLRDQHPAFDEGALRALDPIRAVERRQSQGGTAWAEVERQIEALRRLTE
jgi:argininosuccinate lyase